jgi:protein gp37
MSKIAWTNKTWNPITGCTKTSPGCNNCYAEKFAKRLAGRHGYPADDPFRPATIHANKLKLPLQWKKPCLIFVCSMGDLFHEAVPYGAILAVLSVCNQACHHTFQILTKRAERLTEGLYYPSNVWFGVTAENQQTWDLRTPYLRETDAAVKFVSIEPMLSSIDMGDISWLDWVIVGAESGPGARPMADDWVRHIRDQCQSAGVALFYKQQRVDGKMIKMPALDGRVWDQYPAA